ncbi:MAG: FAD-dependent oxidoreductase [Candidatus Hodarchaeales archaeon]|jgi:electron transfer flavoprotein-quinone oxidoreductase
MTEKENFDVIIVGAGPAGCSTAIRLMQKDPSLNVALIDRGKPIGSKNISGGVIWGQNLATIIPKWWEKAPIERKIIQKRVGFLTKNDSFTVELSFPEWAQDPPNAVSVLLSKFVNWFAKEAENHGVNVFEGITVDDLSKNSDGRFNGIIQAGETFEANVIVIADGANSRLTLSSGIRKGMEKKHYGLGIKEILRLPEDVINERFNLEPMTGMASEYVIGSLPEGIRAGGFLYTNKDTLSIGTVSQIDTMNNPAFPPLNILESYKKHPFIHKMIKESNSVEYSAHWVPEGGIQMLPRLYDSNVLIVGDAAGFVISNGIVIQGINYAISSGISAADTILHAHKLNDFSKKTLKNYEQQLKANLILKDMKTFKKIHTITRNPRLYSQYPELLVNIFKNMLTEQNQAKNHLLKLFLHQRKKQGVGWIRLLRDAITFRHF